MISDLQSALANSLKEFGPYGHPDSLYEPMRYILDLGGKRVRPLLVLLSYSLFKEDYSRAMPAALAVEIFHNFSLIHDDILDESEIRRGKPSVHKAFDDNTAILSGDAMLILSYGLLQSLDPAFIVPALSLFNKTALEICEGQQMDMVFEKKHSVTEAAYLNMIEKKTSVLLACAMQLGGMIGEAGETTEKILYDLGLNLGLAFQLKDDYLDTFGEAGQVGKRIGGDLLNNKKTILTIKAREQLLEQGVQYIDYEDGMPQEDYIKNTTKLLKELNIDGYCSDMIDRYTSQAKRLFEQLNGNEAAMDGLEILLKKLEKRNF